jgi:hypothetical protein
VTPAVRIALAAVAGLAGGAGVALTYGTFRWHAATRALHDRLEAGRILPAHDRCDPRASGPHLCGRGRVTRLAREVAP